jgi:5-methylcytosine-specific restriction endonuclease McrA
MVAVSLRLPPLEGVRAHAAVDAKVEQFRPAASAGASERWPSQAQQQAGALVGLVAGGGAGIQAEVVMHVRGDGCTLDDGTPLAGSSVERIAPASFLRALIHDAERRPINASGAHRHPTRRQKRVVKERDRVCGDCGSSEFLQYDHVPDFEETGHTLIEELFLRCSNCHRDRHGQAPRRE